MSGADLKIFFGTTCFTGVGILCCLVLICTPESGSPEGQCSGVRSLDNLAIAGLGFLTLTLVVGFARLFRLQLADPAELMRKEEEERAKRRAERAEKRKAERKAKKRSKELEEDKPEA